MLHLMNSLRSLTLPAAAALGAFAAGRATVPQEEVAPYLSAGKKVFALVLDEPETARSLPEAGPVEPITIVGVQGRWALLETRGQTRGPVWVNFDQVVSYRTNP